MVVNMEEIKAYYTLSKKQATSSFHLAIWMCILGFLLMVSSVVVPLFTNWNIQISIISAVGGAIVELFAGTTLLVYRTSLTQLNHYYKSLHENERFLSCANLIRKLSTTESQDEMYKELIRSEMTKSLNTFDENEVKQ